MAGPSPHSDILYAPGELVPVLASWTCRYLPAGMYIPCILSLAPSSPKMCPPLTLSLQLLLHQPPCDAPASCVDAKGLASYKKLKSSVLGLFCSVFVCSLYHISSCSVFLSYIYSSTLSLSVDTTTPSLQHSTSIGINFYSIHFPIVGFTSSCWSGITETVLSVSTVDTDICHCLLYNKAHCRIL